MKLSELKQIIRECLDDLEYSQHPKNLPIPYEKKLKKVRKDMTNRFPYDTSYEVGKQSNYRDIPKDDDNFKKKLRNESGPARRYRRKTGIRITQGGIDDLKDKESLSRYGGPPSKEYLKKIWNINKKYKPIIGRTTSNTRKAVGGPKDDVYGRGWRQAGLDIDRTFDKVRKKGKLPK